MKKLMIALMFFMSPAIFAGDLLISWQIPTERENGEPLAIEAIGGYLLKYRQVGENVWSKVLLREASTYQYELENVPPGNYEFTIGAFDSDGLWSNDAAYVYVNVVDASKPKRLVIHVASLAADQPLPDEIIALCETEVECKIETYITIEK